MHVCLPNVYADIQKTRTLLLLVPRFEAFALPIRLNKQRGAHAEYAYAIYNYVSGRI